MDKMGKFISFLAISGSYSSEIFGIQLSGDMCCALKSLKVRIT